jgi:flagellar motor switch/type III secretory pathway protein FliN
MSARPWLPLSSLADETISAGLAEALTAWCEAWFKPPGRITLSIVHAGRPVWAAAGADYRWEVHRATAALAAGPTAMARLCGLALDAPAPFRLGGERDRLVVEEFERRLLGDLAERIEAAFGIAPTARAEPERLPERLEDPWADEETVAALTAFGDGTEAIRVALPARALVPFRRRRATPLLPKRRLTALSAAAAAARVPLAVRLGTSELSLDELRGIGPGDVLLLDRDIEQPAELVADGRAFAHARLVEADGKIRLTIVSGIL